jgi:hypothetical protein
MSRICSPLRSVASKLNTEDKWNRFNHYCYGQEYQVTKKSRLTEARYPRESNVEISGNIFSSFLVNFNVCVEIDGSPVDKFNECKEDDKSNGRECHCWASTRDV